MDEDHAHNQHGKAKGALSKVKHKASKLKNKIKKITHSGGNGADATDLHEDLILEQQKRERARRIRSVLTEGHDGVTDSSSGESDTGDNSDGRGNEMMMYEQLHSSDTSDKLQDNGSDVELHNGAPSASTPSDAHLSSADDSSPVSEDHKSAEPSVHPRTSLECSSDAPCANDNNQAFGGYSFETAPDIKLPRGQQFEMGYPLPGHANHDQIRVFSEDLSTDRKLGIGNDDDIDKGINREQRTAAAAPGDENPTPSPLQDGASEQMYRPVREVENFPSAQTSESINASLYADVLSAEDKFNVGDMGANASDEIPSNQSERDFSFNNQNLMNMGTQMLEKSESDNATNEAEQEKFNNENVTEREEQEKMDGAEQDKSVTDTDDDAVQGSKTEGWGKWSADKLNNAVDDLAFKLGGVDAAETGTLQQTTSDVDYFDPNNADDKKFAEQLAFGGDNADNQESFLDGAVAGSAVVAEKLHELKETISSALGYGSATPSDVPHGGSDEHSDIKETRSLSGGQEDDYDEQQPGFFQGIKEAVVSSFSVDPSSLATSMKSDRSTELDVLPQSAGSDSDVKKSEGTNLSHKLSLGSASDVPQAAFL
ncbi:hypothetical protein L7F22_068638 [Adiantum nelumboides]|nr:hypothetical protein [Adiantum nelumboides]